VLEAQRYVQDGYRVVVDVDLEKFFDRVNHDILMERLARRIDDKAVLRLIRRYLAGRDHGWRRGHGAYEGTPQGGPLSPLWPTCCSTRWIGNWSDGATGSCAMPTTATSMCAVAVRANGCWRACAALRPTPSDGQRGQDGRCAGLGRKFLGYAFWYGPGGQVKCRVADKALKTFKQRIRQLTRRSGGRNLSEIAERLRAYMPGWKAYFQLAQTPKVFRELDEWIDTGCVRAAQALAAGHDDVSGVESDGCLGRGCPQGGGEQSVLVAQQPNGAEPCACRSPTSTGSACLGSHDLNYSNRPVRTRMPGGVGGERSGPQAVRRPYPDGTELHGAAIELEVDEEVAIPEKIAIGPAQIGQEAVPQGGLPTAHEGRGPQLDPQAMIFNLVATLGPVAVGLNGQGAIPEKAQVIIPRLGRAKVVAVIHLGLLP
jgi:hypothetical protein